jgi:SAM-dependent methyltransferase
MAGSVVTTSRQPPARSGRIESASRSGTHVRKNRRYWDGAAETYQRDHAVQLGSRRPVWGTWSIPESKLGALGDVAGLDVLEYGCGGGQWSRWLAEAGARVVGLDLSFSQLRHALQLRERTRASFTLVNADAEATPFTDASFDLVMCDHGAMTFGDPFRTVPEVARLVRPGGAFVFNHASPIHFIAWDDDGERPGERLAYDYFGMRRWDEDSVDFNLPYGEWIRLFRANAFDVEDLIEPRPPANGRTTYTGYVTLEWARRWPAESLWKLRKRST